MPDLTELREAHQVALTQAETIEADAHEIAEHIKRGQYHECAQHELAIDATYQLLNENLDYLRERTRRPEDDV